MKGLLLDTNALLWGLTGDRRLGAGARARIVAGEALFSSVSVLEVTIKTMVGKLDLPGDVAVGAVQAGLVELPFTAAHASALEEFPQLARHDPFDRMLLAQAFVEGRELLTADAELLGLGHDGVVDACT